MEKRAAVADGRVMRHKALVSVYPGLKALAGFRLKPVLRRGGLCR